MEIACGSGAGTSAGCLCRGGGCGHGASLGGVVRVVVKIVTARIHAAAARFIFQAEMDVSVHTKVVWAAWVSNGAYE